MPTRDAPVRPAPFAQAACTGVVVLIPALNEALRIREVVQAALTQCPRVIVVDDGSDDGTAACIADLPVTLIRHGQRMGKGAALRDGFQAALRMGARGIVTLDGDGQHDPADIPRLIAAAQRHPRHIVIGARLRRREQQPWLRRLANGFGDWGIGWACGYRIADSQSGLRYYPAEVAALEQLPGEDFVYEAELLISAARQLGIRSVSVPIEARYAEVHAVAALATPTADVDASTPTMPLRRSHFRPLRDLWRIVRHVAARIFERGHLRADYRAMRGERPLVDDGHTGESVTTRYERSLPYAAEHGR